MPLSDETFERLMAAPNIAVISTIGRDGSPHQAPVWYIWQDGALLIPTERRSQKWRNIERDSRVSICIDTREGPTRVALSSGTADELPADYAPFRQRFYERYHGDGAQAALDSNPVDPADWVVIRITPERTITFGAD